MIKSSNRSLLICTMQFNDSCRIKHVDVDDPVVFRYESNDSDIRVIESISGKTIRGLNFYGKCVKLAEDKVLKEEGIVKCRQCMRQVTVWAGIRTRYGMLVAMQCNCLKYSSRLVSDCLFFVALIIGTEIVCRFQKKGSISNQLGHLDRDISFIWSNNHRFIYRESISKRLVQVLWEDILRGDFENEQYINVPISLTKSKVASACLKTNSGLKPAILWESGKFMLPQDTDPRQPLLQGDSLRHVYWTTIANISKQTCMIAAIDLSSSRPEASRLWMFAVSPLKTHRVCLQVKATYITSSIRKCLVVKSVESEALVFCITEVGGHLLHARRQGLSVIKSIKSFDEEEKGKVYSTVIERKQNRRPAVILSCEHGAIVRIDVKC